ncbi:transcriptional regulator, GntR family [Actinacidiphila yanglinensis]|uniref:Transcriptional regulator, GntR family n=1 Tax=Actinacidiphila yanglinensis TaxID=310779 RepID=A0A1H6AY47_9ACTN|nr:FadR/GntR family transcriptional regulator [Actinacidiphila yanglinensis]SEG52987.1 transcriptional regulator, GntR family [Actinacidiphila yanglinensis]
MTAPLPRGLHGQVVNELGIRIMSGRLPPGATLDLAGLEAEFGISRTVLRESLKVLTAKGLVAARQKRGTYVTDPARWNTLDADVLRWRLSQQPTDALLDQLTEIRLVIEPGLAALAALRRDEHDLAAMDAALAAMRQDEDEPSQVVEHDVVFHRAVLRATHNDLATSLDTVIDQGIRQGYRLADDPGPEGGPLPTRRRLLDAIRDRDATAAERAMQRLITGDRSSPMTRRQGVGGFRGSGGSGDSGGPSRSRDSGDSRDDPPSGD